MYSMRMLITSILLYCSIAQTTPPDSTGFSEAVDWREAFRARAKFSEFIEWQNHLLRAIKALFLGIIYPESAIDITLANPKNVVPKIEVTESKKQIDISEEPAISASDSSLSKNIYCSELNLKNC